MKFRERPEYWYCQAAANGLMMVLCSFYWGWIFAAGGVLLSAYFACKGLLLQRQMSIKQEDNENQYNEHVWPPPPKPPQK